jgi:G6PDH family F420-dependent oxidoreductase
MRDMRERESKLRARRFLYKVHEAALRAAGTALALATREEVHVMRLGFKLMSEEHGPRALVADAVRAEQHGFDFVAISDHFAPWLDEQGHSPFAWSVLGAVAQATDRVGLATAVTCPCWRYHPAIVAQAAATVALLAERPFQLGLGTGERLNEHVIGGGWPSTDVRRERLEEALEMIKRLFAGETCSLRGQHLELQDARLYDLPDEPPEILLAAGGPRAAELAGEQADGLVATEPRRDLVTAYRKAGGEGACMAEVGLCWAESEEAAREVIHRYARWSGLGWPVLTELPTPAAFAAASKAVQPEDVADEIPHGPELERFVTAVREFEDAGFDQFVLRQIGPDQKGFLRFFERELRPALMGGGRRRALKAR